MKEQLKNFNRGFLKQKDKGRKLKLLKNFKCFIRLQCIHNNLHKKLPANFTLKLTKKIIKIN
jgi:hypothetical protein